MGELLTVGHSFNAGDSLTILPGLQEIYKQTGKKIKFHQRLDMKAFYFDDANHPVKTDGVQVCMNKQTLLMMKPLMEAQNYIAEYKEWKGEEVWYNFDLTRQDARIPLPGGDIHAWATLIFPQLSCDLSEPWLNVTTRFLHRATMSEWYNRKGSDYIVLNFTERYRNPYIDYHFLKQYEDQLIFAGLEHEHRVFCEKWELNIPRLFVNNFLELAQAINEAKFGIYCQSMCWHIADAMKKPRILEVCSSFPNVFPTGADGYAFIAQQALEYFVTDLLKK